MIANKSTMSANDINQNELPAHHTCPWLLQYVLAMPLRRLVESPEKTVGACVAPGMTVLEPGPGFGFFTLPMARMVGPGGKVVSVDIEPRAIEKLKSRAKKKGLGDRIDARPCGPRELGLEEYREKIDVAILMNVLHEMADIPGFLAQVTGLLKPGGRMLLAEPKGHVSPRNFEAELELCRKAGFRVLDPPSCARGRPAALLAREG